LSGHDNLQMSNSCGFFLSSSWLRSRRLLLLFNTQLKNAACTSERRLMQTQH